MFSELQEINKKPEPFSCYTAEDLWTDNHTSQKMLDYHLDGAVDICSRKTEFIERSVAWMVNHFQLNRNTPVIDFGCGPGLYTNRFAEMGIPVTGIDFSARSIEYAKQYAWDHALEAQYIHHNYLEFSTDKQFDLITLIFCDYSALGPDRGKTCFEYLTQFLIQEVELSWMSIQRRHSMERMKRYGMR